MPDARSSRDADVGERGVEDFAERAVAVEQHFVRRTFGEIAHQADVAVRDVAQRAARRRVQRQFGERVERADRRVRGVPRRSARFPVRADTATHTRSRSEPRAIHAAISRRRSRPRSVSGSCGSSSGPAIGRVETRLVGFAVPQQQQPATRRPALGKRHGVVVAIRRAARRSPSPSRSSTTRSR